MLNLDIDVHIKAQCEQGLSVKPINPLPHATAFHFVMYVFPFFLLFSSLCIKIPRTCMREETDMRVPWCMMRDICVLHGVCFLC